MSLAVQTADFQHMLRVMNTNLDGKAKVPYALRSVKGVGRRLAILACRKTGIDEHRRAGTLSAEEVDMLVKVISAPEDYKIPSWFLNRIHDPKDGLTGQMLSNQVDNKLREDLDRLKKMRNHRGFRHLWGLRVRGQHTKTTGRRGRTVGVSKKK
eukprot:TRINITY_DN16114_c0_g1_i3.p2 TRINITY_DN16114_c0_g1~~TRINITY_DN16114_c0_g1_i3.p2  ORF type:complete len:154 (+),score=31.75 TRINITY_DN16114_c0_g1_i3:53-514(+)